MKKKISKMLILFFLIMCALTTISFAEEEAYVVEKSETYKKWESLSKDERNNTIMPEYYDISIKESIRRSKYNTLLLGNTSLESYFNLADLYDAIIKDQMRTPACWAFATMGVLESNIAIRNNLPLKGYSPYHMEYFTCQMYNRGLEDGGNIDIALAYMINGNGPVLETDFPTESVYDENKGYYIADLEDVDLSKIAQLKINKTTDFPAVHKEYAPNGIIYTYEKYEVEVLRQNVKQHIKEHGAVIASMYINMQMTPDGGYASNFYDSTNNIFCCTDNTLIPNHQVPIVGWDDTKRAYIAQNSYGKTFGDNGYFYISYDDVFIEEAMYGITNLEKLTADSYDNIYQYDELGMNYSIGLGSKTNNELARLTELYYANVFNRNSTQEEEYINEVGVYVANTTGIEIYVNSKDGEFVNANNISKLKLVSSGQILEPGYHVIELNASEDTKLTGDKFIVAVKLINQEGARIPLETNYKASGLSNISTFYDTAVANLGESLYSVDAITWKDINGLKVPFEDGLETTLAETNVCVRAFTKYVRQEPENISVTGVQLDKTTIILKEGETENLTATILPENATNKNITWTSSNESVASISNGVVTAIKEGTATITVKTEDGNYTASCEIIVEKRKISVTGITLTPERIELEEGQTAIFTATVLPENATNKNITWTSSNESVVVISNGIINAVNEGSATITVKTEDGNYTATAQIIVKPATISVTGVTLNESSKTLKMGESCTLVATVLPKDATNKNVTWESLNRNVATVANGVVTAVGVGKTTVIVKTVDGNYTANCEITVKEAIAERVDVTSVILNKSSETLKIGETLNLIPTINPSNATNKNVTWTSSNTNVATVSNGVVTARGIGKATITVKTEDGNYTATCEITVEEIVINVTSIALDKNNERLKIGETVTLIPTINPPNATNKNVTWTSSNESVATVSNGIVTALKSGNAVITVKTEDGNYTATCNITVEEDIINVTGVNITVETVEMQVGNSLILYAEILPENATNKNITWESSNEEIVQISEGVITALKPGVATVTVRTEDGNFTDTVTITVKENKVIRVESIKLNKEKLEMEVSDKSTLIVTFNPESPTNTNVKWESSNPKVATVDQNGIVTAKKKGTTVITATSEDGGYIAKCTVKVTKNVDDPDDIYKDQDDNSTSNKPLPNTGIKTVTIFVAIAILIFMVYNFIRYRRLIDVK